MWKNCREEYKPLKLEHKVWQDTHIWHSNSWVSDRSRRTFVKFRTKSKFGLTGRMSSAWGSTPVLCSCDGFQKLSEWGLATVLFSQTDLLVAWIIWILGVSTLRADTYFALYFSCHASHCGWQLCFLLDKMPEAVDWGGGRGNMLTCQRVRRSDCSDLILLATLQQHTVPAWWSPHGHSLNGWCCCPWARDVS